MNGQTFKNRTFMSMVALLYAVATSGSLMIALLFNPDIRIVLVVAAVTLLVFNVLFISRKVFGYMIFLIIVGTIVLISIVNRAGTGPVISQTVNDYIRWLIQAFTALRREDALFDRISEILIVMGYAGLCFFFIAKKIRLIPLLLISLPVYIIPYYSRGETSLAYMLIGAFTLLLLLALSVFRDQVGIFYKAADTRFENKYLLYILPIILVITITGWMLTNMHRPDRSSATRDLAQRIEEQLREWNLVRDSRFAFGGEFSLQSSGFQPGGRLGGNVLERTDLALMVESNRPVYLKGSIRDRYVGNAWRPSTRRAYNIRYMNIHNYVTDSSFSEREVFEAAMHAIQFSLDRANYDTFFREDAVNVTHYKLRTNTIFYPNNVIRIELSEHQNRRIRMNNNAELYFAFNLVDESEYTIGYRYFLMGNPYSEHILRNLGEGVLDDFLEKEENIELKERYEEIYERYTEDLFITPRVAALARQLTSEADNRYDQAVAIETYLKENFTYSLTPGSVPENLDFVEYFLFANNYGYCTYYASAMTVMLRALGIPARYVEGFITQEENRIGNIYSVLQNNSHSWVEVFFEGVGWITFEPTPTFEGVPGPGLLEENGEDVVDGDFMYEEDIWAWIDDAYLDDFFSGEPDLGFDEEEEMTNDEWVPPSSGPTIPWLMIGAGVLAALFLYVPLRVFFIRLIMWIDRKKDPNHGIQAYYARILKLLDLAEMSLKPGETLMEMNNRSHIVIKSAGNDLKKATDAFLSIRFSDMKRGPHDVMNVVRVYRKMSDDIKFYVGPWRFFVRRYLKGAKVW